MLLSIFKWGIFLFISKLLLQIAANYLIVIYLVLKGIPPNDWHEIYSIFLSGITYQIFVYFFCYRASLDYLKNTNIYKIKIPSYDISFAVLIVTSLSVIIYGYIFTKKIEYSYIELLPILMAYLASKKAEANFKIRK